MLSSQACNALLKTIEEPPPHVIFILATTEIHKVPATIASRCQQFRFSRIDVEESTKRLCEIAKKENVNITEDAARLISRLSDGGMRDAVSLLDQCISVSADIDDETVRTTAGIAGTEHLFTLAQCIHEQNAPEALSRRILCFFLTSCCRISEICAYCRQQTPTFRLSLQEAEQETILQGRQRSLLSEK